MWRVARSLDVLLGEINAAAPNRSKVSDGSIGDADHATRTSDHNPWITLRGEGIVRARDFTHDPAGGLDCNILADRLAAIISAGAHPAARSGAYVIWQRRILSFDRRAEGWRYYGGTNPHDHHCHLSVATDPGGFDSTQPWGVMSAPATQEDDMALDDKALEQIAQAVWAKKIGGGDNRKPARLHLIQAANASLRNEKVRDQITALHKAVSELPEGATKAEIRRMLDHLDAEIQIVVNDPEES